MSDAALRPGAVAVGVFDAAQRLTAHTPDLAALLGLAEAEFAPGQDLQSLLGHLDCGTPAPPFSLQCHGEDGRLLELAAQPLSAGGWSLAVADISGAQAAAEALREARANVEAGARAKSRFLATMNHELRTPLNAVIGFAETLAHDAVNPGARLDPKETEEFALHIRDAGRHLLGLIDDMLDLVRIDSGAYELAQDMVDLGRLVQAAVRPFQTAMREGGIALELQDAAGGTRLRGDERRLRRLLFHLLDNAVKFTRGGGRVRVSTGPAEAGGVEITVRDTGVGMEPEDLQRVLQPFHQLDARLARRAGGAGIGLYLARAIAEAHGGALLLESRPGQGTTATLRLPAARLLAPPPSLQPAQEQP